jgi:hypothetical protein
MAGYISSLITVSIIGGIVSNLVSGFSNIKRYVNYFVGLVAVICLLSPIFSFINNMTSFKMTINNFFDKFVNQEIIDNTNDIIINSGIESIEGGIKSALIERFEFDEKEIIIELEADKSNIEAIKISKITVILTGKASWNDVDLVKEYLNNVIGGNIIVKRK